MAPTLPAPGLKAPKALLAFVALLLATPILAQIDSLGSSSDLGVSVDDGRSYMEAGVNTYNVIVTNAGPSDATGATLSCILPSPLAGCQWTCEAFMGQCTPSGSGNISDTFNLDVGGELLYRATCDVPSMTFGLITVTATVVADKGSPDPNSTNDTDSDTTDLTDIVFEDGFEAGDLNRWSSFLP